MMLSIIAALIAGTPMQDMRETPRAMTLGQAIALGTADACAQDATASSCEEQPADRFRLAGPGEVAPDAKARAFANNGVECGVVGAARCRPNGIPFLRRELSQGPR